MTGQMHEYSSIPKWAEEVGVSNHDQVRGEGDGIESGYGLDIRASVSYPRKYRDRWRLFELTSHVGARATPAANGGVIGLVVTSYLYHVYLTPSTVPAFIGAAVGMTFWVLLSWIGLLLGTLGRREPLDTIGSKWSGTKKTRLGLASILLSFWTVISSTPRVDTPPPSMPNNGEKYFIAANLHNSEAILPDFIHELTQLIFHLGRYNVFISIYDSDSLDETSTYLTAFEHTLTELVIEHRIVSVDEDSKSWWPYHTAPERIEFLAKCRNKAIEPLQSNDSAVRLPNWDQYGKVIFLNDIRFRWQDIVKLILTRVEGEEDEDYDLACAIDHGSAGLYDTWVARDICGVPFRAFWPFASDVLSRKAIQRRTPFEVGSCWNGAVSMNAEPLRYKSNGTSPATSNLTRRAWKMVDGVAPEGGAVSSPPLESPLRFRSSGISACDHSECFLYSYDLHRYFRDKAGRSPRILMNPAVEVAYDAKWFHWNTVILRQPVIQWWRAIWSHRIGYWLFDWPFEYFGRKRDYCTWAGLIGSTEEGRCAPLPGAKEQSWYS